MKNSFVLKYILLAIFFAVLLYTLQFYFSIHKSINHRLLPLQSAVHKIQSDITQSHLWLEEFISSEQNLDAQEDIYENLDNAISLGYALKKGGKKSSSYELKPIKNQEYEQQVDEIIKSLNGLSNITRSRFNSIENSGIGSKIEKEYDNHYNILMLQLEALYEFIEIQISTKSQIHKNTKNVLLALSLIIGVATLFLMVFLDIRNIKTRKKLVSKRGEMANILNSAPIGIFHFDMNYNITDCNPKFEEIIGTKADILIGMNLVRDLNDKELKVAVQEVYRFGESKFEGIYHSVTANKSTPVIVDFKVLKNKANKIYSAIGLVRDLTHEYEIQKELEDSEERFRSISELANDMIIMMNNKGEIDFWNKSAEKILGYRKEEVLGKNLHDIIAPQRYHGAHHKAFKIWKHTGKGDAIGKTLELNALHKDGHEITIDLSLSSIKIQGEWNAIGIIRDATERKQHEKQLIEAKEKAEESDRLKTAFLSNISHEIRTPMNGIIGFADLLKDPNISGDQLIYFIDIIEQSSQRMLNIINDIIVISKIETGDISLNKESFKVDEVMFTFISPLQREVQEKGIALTYHSKLNESQQLLKTDFEKFQHIVLNLLKNAIKFTSKGNVEVITKHQNGQFLIEVKDTGIGISKEHQELIFERFRQVDSSRDRQYEGAGLGLSISKAYSDLLGGEISVESEVGKGSIFTLSIPQDIAKEEKQIEDAPQRAIKDKLTILVAEDEYPSFILMNEYLSYLNAEVIHAKDGLEALTYAKNHDVDLILMDLKMPNMSGYQAIPLIKAEKPNVPIIAQTAYAMTGDEEKAIEIGSDDYIRKPIDDTILKIKIKRHLSL
jgi:PAS domain S-box-containing protein